jgi:uncharacterized protein
MCKRNKKVFMKKRTRLTGVLFLLIFLSTPLTFCQSNEASEPIYTVKEELNIKIPMRDGINLSANIFLPNYPGKFPVLLMRTPYSKDGESEFAHFFAQRGYVVVIQDTRGRYKSEGLFNAFQPEVPDGYDTQQWIGEQAWCNGKIGTVGGSYVGFTQWMPAPLASSYLKTMFTSKTFSDFYKEAYIGGAFRILRFSPWSYNMSKPDIVESSFLNMMYDSAYRCIPFIEQDKVLGWKIPYLRDWLSHPTDDKYWERSSVKNNFTRINTSIYNLGGWFDSFQQATLDNYIRMTAPDIDPDIRTRQKLIMGPWVHGSESNKAGDMDFGLDAAIDSRNLELRWFDSQLKDIDNGILDEAPVKIFVMGENIWRDEYEWPLARTDYQKYYLHSKGNANSLTGDGKISTKTPSKEFSDTFVYDPLNPVITPGRDEPIDQRKVEVREDVLVYSTPVLNKEIEVTGPVNVLLYASSSAINTDFTAKLVDVYPDGRAIRLCEGIIRASFRDPASLPSEIQPNKVYKYNISLWSTSNLFKKGHQIRVEISSSNFPRFDRNLNTGIFPALDSTYVKATQTILHNKEYPSCIILPVIR